MQALKDQKQLLTEQRHEELKRQAEYLTNAFAEAALKERATRLGALSQVELHLRAEEPPVFSRDGIEASQRPLQSHCNYHHLRCEQASRLYRFSFDGFCMHSFVTSSQLARARVRS